MKGEASPQKKSRTSRVALFAVVGVVLASCALDLDASRLEDAGVVDSGIAEAGTAARDALAVGPGPAVGPDASATCAIDADCTSADRCLTPRCDIATKTCAFDECPTPACLASSCDLKALSCRPAAAYGFHAASFAVALGPVGCGGIASRCVAASHPFVFVGTANGVVAYDEQNPTNAAPPAIPVTGLPFLPSWIVANGARVYFVGQVVGSGPAYKLPLAWIDVPTSGRVTSLNARTVFVSYAQPSISRVLVAGAGGLFLEYDDGNQFFPVALASAPLMDLDALALFPSPGIASGASPFASSGARLVTYRWANDSGSLTSYFGFETAAGTPNAQNAGEQSVFASMGPTYPQPVFADGANGSLLWSTPTAAFDDAGTPVEPSARVAWLATDAAASTFDASAHVDIETYVPPAVWGTAVAGPIAWVDAATALVLARAPGTAGQTSVQVITRKPAPALVPGRRYVLPVTTAQVGAASSHGMAYVLAADAPDRATLHVFAPGCDL